MTKGGWVYIMADRYRGTLYVGVTANLTARVHQHRLGEGADFCRRYGLRRLVWAEQGQTIEACIAHEKRLKRWRRTWKFALIERDNPDWRDLFETLPCTESGVPDQVRDDGGGVGPWRALFRHPGRRPGIPLQAHEQEKPCERVCSMTVRPVSGVPGLRPE